MNGYLKVYDITRHDHRQLFHPRSGYDLFENFGEIIAAKCNGSFMAVLLANESLIPDGRVYCWNYQNDTVNYFDFLKCKDENGGGDGGSGSSAMDDKSPSSSSFVAKLPVGIYWDTDDHRLLAVQTKVIHIQASNKKDNTKLVADSQAIIMFQSEKGALNVLEAKDMYFGEELIALCIPHLITLNINSISRITMRDFQGMENCDEETRTKIIDFSLHIS
uniref:IFT140 second beta-propeller domain-containing protein n=1 Tax=Megaselia scalaris TaxID=36166 RepID=T1GZR6_MEGSC